MKRKYEHNPVGPYPTATFMVRGKIAPLTMDSFAGSPAFEKNGIAKIRFRADVSDLCGSLEQVAVWDGAAREMLKTDGSDSWPFGMSATTWRARARSSTP